MGALDDVIGAAVDPEVEVGGGAERVVTGEAGEGGDVETEFLGAPGGFDHIGGLAAAADQDEDIFLVGVEVEGAGDPMLVTAVVAEGGDEVSVVEGHGTDPALLGKIGGEVAGDGGAGPVAGEEDFASRRACGGDAFFEPVEQGRDFGIGEEARIFGKVKWKIHLEAEARPCRKRVGSGMAPRRGQGWTAGSSSPLRVKMVKAWSLRAGTNPFSEA